MNLLLAILILPVVFALLYFVLPAGATFPAWVHAGAVGVGGYLKVINAFVDVGHLFIALAFIVALEVVILIWKGVRYTLNLVHGSGA